MQPREVMKMINKPRGLMRLLAASLCLLLATPISVLANHLDVARLATQLNLASGQLAHELRGSGAYSTIRQRSEQLSREAAELVDVVRRNRNTNQVQSQFRDVSQRFVSLERALLRLRRNDYSHYVFNEFDRLSDIYSSLSEQFHYAGDYGFTQPYVYNPPVIIYQPGPVPGYEVPYGSPRSLPPDLPRSFQPGFVNPPSLHYPDEQILNVPRHPRDYRYNERYENPLRHEQRLPDYDHRSPVLDRQQYLDHRSGVIERGRSGGNIETSRRNHHE